MATAALLEDRAVIALKGPAAREFLQGLISGDMAACTTRSPIYAALLTPQGKILFEFFVIDTGEDGFLLDCARSRAPELLSRLTLYRLRAKVEISLAPGLGAAAVWNVDPLPATGIADPRLILFPDPRLPALGLRIVGPTAAVEHAIKEMGSGDYDAHRLQLGVPGSADIAPDAVFALDAGFEDLHGVSFKKGCYVGQEVTARMKHRATARRRFLIAESTNDLPPAGTPVLAGTRELGQLGSGKCGRALALIRLDRLDEATRAGEPITAAGRSVGLRKPDWLRL